MDEGVDKGRFSYVGSAGKGHLGPIRRGVVALTVRTLDKADFHALVSLWVSDSDPGTTVSEVVRRNTASLSGYWLLQRLMENAQIQGFRSTEE